MTPTPLNDLEIRRALADVLDLAPLADVALNRAHATAPPRDRHLLVSVAAGTIVIAGIASVVTVTSRDNERAAGTATGASPQQSAAAPTGARPSTPGQVGWPPLFTLGPDWSLHYFNQTSPDSGDFEFHSMLSGADTTWGAVYVTDAPGGEVLAADAVAGDGVIRGMWLASDDRAADLGLTRGDNGAVEGEPMTFAGEPARVFYIAEQHRFFVIVDLPQGDIEIAVPGDDRATVDAALANAAAVDTAAFDATLPESVVVPDSRSDAIVELLGDTPQPDGFDTTDLAVQDFYSARSVLANELVGRVACGWIETLFSTNGEDAGAFATAAEALDASATWPVAVAVGSDGFPPVIARIVDTLDPDGNGLSDQYGRAFPLTMDDATTDLGCGLP